MDTPNKPTSHLHNWLRPSQMVCGVAVEGRTPVREVRLLTCERCIVKLLRTGYALGLDQDHFGEWSIPEIEEQWTPERAADHQNHERQERKS